MRVSQFLPSNYVSLCKSNTAITLASIRTHKSFLIRTDAKEKFKSVFERESVYQDSDLKF